MGRKFFLGIVLLFFGLLFSCITGSYTFEKPNILVERSQILLFDELSILYPDKLEDGFSLEKLVLFSEGKGGFYFLIDAPTVGDQSSKVTIEFDFPSFINSNSLSLFEVIEIPVEFNTGIYARTELIDRIKNPYVIRRAPFYIYEALMPIEKGVSFSSSDGKNSLQFETAQKGRKLYCLQLEATSIDEKKQEIITLATQIGSDSFTQEIETVFYPVILNEELAMDYIVWHSMDNFEAQSNSEPYSDKWYADLFKMATLMKEGRQNVFSVPWNIIFDKEEGSIEPVLMEERLDRYLKTFFDAGLKYPSTTTFAERKDGEWMARQLSVVKEWDATSEEAKQYLESALTQLKEYLESRKLSEVWLISISDEPDSPHAKDYQLLASYVRQFLPGIPILEATKGRNSLVGAIDIWCPTVDQYELNRNFFLERQELNEEVWVYTCLDPGGAWLNRLLDQERLRQVWFGWVASQMGVTGYLHWGFNYYRIDPWTQSVIPFHSAGGPKTSNNQLPAGDSHIVFPYKDGFIPGVRLESMRIGMEDYILLQMLRQKNPTLTDSLINELVQGYKSYSKSVSDYRVVREKLLMALSSD